MSDDYKINVDGSRPATLNNGAGVAMPQASVNARFSQMPLLRRELDLLKELAIAAHRGILKAAKGRTDTPRCCPLRDSPPGGNESLFVSDH